jgi:putative phosphoesterase
LAKIALISDIHANLPALEAVYLHARSIGVQAMLNAGDLVGYGPFPDEVITFIREKMILSVIGDYDQKVILIKQKQERWQKKKKPLKLLAFNWAHDHISIKNLTYLESLPKTLEHTIFNVHFLLTHGSPENISEHLSKETQTSRFQELANQYNVDVIVSGNTHQFFQEKIHNILFINPGSVGRQDDGCPDASYAILEIDKEISVKQYRIPYDVQNVLTALESYNLPEEFKNMFLKGLSLNEVLR